MQSFAGRLQSRRRLSVCRWNRRPYQLWSSLYVRAKGCGSCRIQRLSRSRGQRGLPRSKGNRRRWRRISGNHRAIHRLCRRPRNCNGWGYAASQTFTLWRNCRGHSANGGRGNGLGRNIDRGPCDRLCSDESLLRHGGYSSRNSAVHVRRVDDVHVRDVNVGDVHVSHIDIANVSVADMIRRGVNFSRAQGEPCNSASAERKRHMPAVSADECN